MSARTFGLATAALTVVAIALFALGGAHDNHRPARKFELVQLPQADAATHGAPSVQSTAAPGTDPMPAPALIRSALGLPDHATIRKSESYDARYDIVCGEVSLGGAAPAYRRFVYVGIAKSGQIDDGSADFRSYSSEVCRPQP